MRGNLYDISFKPGNVSVLALTVNADEARAVYDQLSGKELDITLKQYRDKRSLNSNAYAWLLIGKIADVLRSSKDEVYFDMLRRYGQSVAVSVREDAAQAFEKSVKYCDEFGESELTGKLFKHYRVYKGSSEFDTHEMSILIDGIVSEAKELDIETMTPDEIAAMNARWGNG